jgi:hypothetical protein
VKAALTDQILIRNDKIWTARPRIDHVVIFQASALRIFNAAALIGLVAAEDLAAIASAAAVGLAEVTDSAAEDLAVSAVEDSVAAASADSVVEASAVFAADGDKINAWNFKILFLKRGSNHKPTTEKDMKKLLTLTSIASIGTVLALISASEATAASGSEISRKEALLAQSGFKVVTATTPEQKKAINGLAQGRCSAVTFNKKLFYVFPTAKKDKFYVGKQAQFNKYKKAIAAQQGSKPASM